MMTFIFVLLSGVIKDDFLVDQDSVDGFQVNPEVAVAPNGNFAVAWGDSLDYANSAGFIRFFDSQGDPFTSSRKLSEKIIGCAPRIAVSNTGQISCVWYESDNPWSWSLYGQTFDSEGEALCDRFLIVADSVAGPEYACASQPEGGFLVTWVGYVLCGQRYDSMGVEVGERITIYEPEEPGRLDTRCFSNDINHDGTAAVTWNYLHATLDCNIRFQIVDSLNNLVIPDSFYHVCEDSALAILHRWPQVRWLDDERFAIFWLKDPLTTPYVDPIKGIQAKIFDAHGDSLTPIRTVLEEPQTIYPALGAPLSLSSSPHNGLFAVAYNRHWDYPLSAVMGFLADTSLTRTTGIFRLASSERHEVQAEDYPSVDANSERIVWVWQDNSQKRLYDTTLIDPYYPDIHCKITDWDLVGISEPVTPVTHPVTHQFEIANPIGREIVLRYWNRPEGFQASVYDVAGRKVDEIGSNQTSGTITWGECYGPGVYFIHCPGGSAVMKKVVLVR